MSRHTPIYTNTLPKAHNAHNVKSVKAELPYTAQSRHRQSEITTKTQYMVTKCRDRLLKPYCIA